MSYRALRAAIFIPLLAVFFVLSFYNLSLNGREYVQPISQTAPTNIIPLKGDKGDPAVVDYQKVKTMVQQEVTNQVDALPKPKDGTNGVNGQDGSSIPGPAGPVGQSVQGPPGDNGPAGKEVEFRYNDVKARLEWRYVGDENWQILVNVCQLTASCPIP